MERVADGASAVAKTVQGHAGGLRLRGDAGSSTAATLRQRDVQQAGKGIRSSQASGRASASGSPPFG